MAPALTTVLLALDPGSAHAAGPALTTSGFYADPDSSAQRWVNANRGDGRAAAIQASIANVPSARWFGNWSGAVGTATGAYTGAAAAMRQTARPRRLRHPRPGHLRGPVRRRGGQRRRVPDVDRRLRRRRSAPGRMVVVLEPDSLGDESCMSQAQISERNVLLSGAVAQFNAKAPNTRLYLDAGNPAWLSAETMARHLAAAGVAGAHGFSLNVSNYLTTAQNVAYGNAVNAALKSTKGFTKPFVVDTSRNGNGSDGAWCNPAGRRIGTPTGWGGGAEMLLWIKVPGESDGNCGVGTGSTAGQFLPEVAYKMIYGY